MFNQEQFEKLGEYNQQQSTINKEMVEISKLQLQILRTMNEDVFTKLYQYKDKDIPAELTNTFITSFSKLWNYYNLFLEQYNEKLTEQFEITSESLTIFLEGYARLIKDEEDRI